MSTELKKRFLFFLRELRAAVGGSGPARGHPYWPCGAPTTYWTLGSGACGATAADLEGLGEEVRERVLSHSGIRLEWEIMRVGEPAPEAD